MSYSGAESGMEDGGARPSNGHHRRQHNGVNTRRKTNGYHNQDSEGGNPEAWNAFADSFSKVQTVLDRNRELIQRANENHQSRIPDNMAKNVAIIQELNGNITKVASIYSDLSSNFTGRVRQHRKGSGSRNGDVDD